MGGLDHIVTTGGTITEAVSSMIWPGEAVVHVSIVNWVKGEQPGLKRLYNQDGNLVGSGWRYEDLARIPSSLSFHTDVTTAKALEVNKRGGCHQGQTHGHKSFLIPINEAQHFIHNEPVYAEVLKPFLTSDDLVGEHHSKPTRYVIDFSGKNQLQAAKFERLFKRIQAGALPAREAAAKKEAERNRELADIGRRGNQHHANFLKRWWQMSYGRNELMRELRGMGRYIVCGQVTKRPIFDFVSPRISPNAALTVFTHEDDYTFGVLQSTIHWKWFDARCSTIKSDPRYTSNTVFDSFPWPQSPSLKQVKDIAAAGVALRELRRELCREHGLTLRELYRSIELPGDHPLKTATAKLDQAVRAAYGLKGNEDVLAFLLALNHKLAQDEADGNFVVGPGLPEAFRTTPGLVTIDCISP